MILVLGTMTVCTEFTPLSTTTRQMRRQKVCTRFGNDINETVADMSSAAYDGDFPDHMEKASDMDIFANQGTFCYNIEDVDDNNNYGTAGYLTLQQDAPYYDPDQEDAWINQCNNSH